jgi:hypothetical protein
MNTQTQEVVTTTEDSIPSQVTRRTTTRVAPEVKVEAPQKVFDKKKRIFRINQIIWYVLGVVEIVLAFRIVLKAIAADQSSGFTSLIYSLTGPLALPFRGIVGESVSGSSLIEWSSVFALVVYLVIAGGLVYLLDLINPVSQEEVEATV